MRSPPGSREGVLKAFIETFIRIADDFRNCQRHFVAYVRPSAVAFDFRTFASYYSLGIKYCGGHDVKSAY